MTAWSSSDMPASSTSAPCVAVIVPCYNEALSIAKVITDFRAALPGADIYVCDNNSTDRTAEVAREHGAIVSSERRQGKGHVMRRMFAEIDADIYVLVDGDDTYRAASAPAMVALLQERQLDMVIGSRMATYHDSSSRQLHHAGNRGITFLINTLFGSRLADVLSGYRVMSRAFVKALPFEAGGFEVETRLTVQALELDAAIEEMEVPYGARTAGSVSKLRTLPDGWRILRTIIYLFKEAKPLPFFIGLAALLMLLCLGLGLPVVYEFLETKLVERVPTAILAASMGVLSALSLACGVILDSVKNSRLETKRLFYLLQKRLDGIRASGGA
jgi:glycosyltransferase involved in cell wall biosynthesis